MDKPLLTLYQRKCLTEYLMVASNIPHCQSQARQLIDEAYSIVDNWDHSGLTSVASIEQATLELSGVLSSAVERWIDLHRLYDKRDQCQFKIVRERGKLRPVPGQLVQMMLAGTSNIDLLEFHKMSDSTLKQLAAPYTVGHIDEPLTQVERDPMAAYVLRRIQPLYQWSAFTLLKASIEKEAQKSVYKFLAKDEAYERINNAVQEQLVLWLARHPFLRDHEHGFSIHLASSPHGYTIVFSSDFELLEKGQHPLDFVDMNRETWTDRMIRSTHHEEFIKELKGNIRNV